jgi:hypothetical protein
MFKMGLLLHPRLKVFVEVVPIVYLFFLHILFRHQLVAWKANTQPQLSHSSAHPESSMCEVSSSLSLI